MVRSHQSVTLPPGKYKFEGSVDWFNKGSRNDTYLVAMPGTNGLPDVDQVNTALASAKLGMAGGGGIPLLN